MPTALPTLPEPALRDAVRDAVPFLARVVDHGYANAEGGDVANHGSATSIVRHVANYLLASEAIAGAGVPAGADLLDVGCGTAALSAWLADRHGLRLHLADHDPGVLEAAASSFDVAATVTDLAAAPRCAVVTAMEVLEHVPPAEQPAFVAALLDRVADGGVLVISTPDESHYPGGWSGYAPHVGCVTPARLEALLVDAGVADPTVLRLHGGAFELPWWRRLAERVGNRAWAWLQARVPQGAAWLSARVAGRHHGIDVPRDDALFRVSVDPPARGRGGGFVALARR
ncbi:MAG: class I SAM-dependent methyltransferase [Actinomycetes bacterium]